MKLNIYQKIFALIVTLLLTACGASTEEKSEEVPIEKSTLLKKNSVPSDASFANFDTTSVSIDPSALPFVGNNLFLKLAHADGEVIYLGQIDRFSIFSIDVDIKLDTTQLNYELFTSDENDDTHFGVVTL